MTAMAMRPLSVQQGLTSWWPMSTSIQMWWQAWQLLTSTTNMSQEASIAETSLSMPTSMEAPVRQVLATFLLQAPTSSLSLWIPWRILMLWPHPPVRPHNFPVAHRWWTFISIKTRLRLRSTCRWRRTTPELTRRFGESSTVTLVCRHRCRSRTCCLRVRTKKPECIRSPEARSYMIIHCMIIKTYIYIYVNNCKHMWLIMWSIMWTLKTESTWSRSPAANWTWQDWKGDGEIEISWTIELTVWDSSRTGQFRSTSRTSFPFWFSVFHWTQVTIYTTTVDNSYTAYWRTEENSGAMSLVWNYWLSRGPRWVGNWYIWWRLRALFSSN